jgi:hypothetical protein
VELPLGSWWRPMGGAGWAFGYGRQPCTRPGGSWACGGVEWVDVMHAPSGGGGGLSHLELSSDASQSGNVWPGTT